MKVNMVALSNRVTTSRYNMVPVKVNVSKHQLKANSVDSHAKFQPEAEWQPPMML